MAPPDLVRMPGTPLRTRADGSLEVAADPILGFIEGDGTGRDIWRASVRVFDAAVEKAFGGERRIAWHEVLAGQKAFGFSRMAGSLKERSGAERVTELMPGIKAIETDLTAFLNDESRSGLKHRFDQAESFRLVRPSTDDVPQANESRPQARCA